MTLEELKIQIENKTLKNPEAIFVCKNQDSFIVLQYIKQIADLFNLSIQEIERLPKKSIIKSKAAALNIYRCKEYEGNLVDGTIIVTEKCSTGIKIPKLEDWMLLDYVSTQCPGLKTPEWICNRYKNDPYRIYNEVAKISIFNEKEQQLMFEILKDQNNYDDVETSNALDLSTAIENFDNEAVKSILENKATADITLFFVLTVIHNKLLQMLKVKTNKTLTLANTGCSTDKQLSWMKSRVKNFSSSQLLKMFCCVQDADYNLKGSGSLSEDQSFDYFITHIIMARDGKR